MILLWLIFGSLWSVLLTRFADGVTRAKLRGFFFWFSKCPNCKHRLKAKDLIPLLSYFFQWGKCRYCGAKISWIYPLLEMLSAWIFLWTYIWLQDFWTGFVIFWIVTNRLLLLLLIYDIQKYELHMSTRTLLLTTVIVWNIIFPHGNLWNALFASVLFIGAFLFIYIFSKRYVKIRFKIKQEWFWEWDIYLALVVGMYLPIILWHQNILFSGSMIIKTLIIFILMSSIIWLFRAGFQYFFTKIFGIWDEKQGTWKKASPTYLVPRISSLQVIPFFPAMIIAFWILAWKCQFFITLLFG